jgi:hypothetical protein
VAAALAACGDDAPQGWTVAQAESVTTIRGLPVRVLSCRGVGEGEAGGDGVRYDRLRCEAGARRPGESFDTVGVLYEIRPTDDGHVLERVRFIGGPGIP